MSLAAGSAPTALAHLAQASDLQMANQLDPVAPRLVWLGQASVAADPDRIFVGPYLVALPNPAALVALPEPLVARSAMADLAGKLAAAHTCQPSQSYQPFQSCLAWACQVVL
mmetsp:Transcript_24611/g.47972  ORF Transcript_24611/g.47972 Transcript_24611/m.47972 type:complete len:112 (-) Transcript_24611:1085-1420(-)